MIMRWILLSLLVYIPSAFALDYPYISRSARGLLMGDAFTAINDDAYTLFYNPASLARHKNDFTLHPLPFMASVTNILDDIDKYEDFPDDPVGAADLMMDQSAHAGYGLAPGFKLFNFGVNFIYNESIDLLLRNRTHPMLDMDIRSDRGVVFGAGIPIGPGRLNAKTKNGMQTSIGVSAKYLQRTGVKDTIALTGPTAMGTLGQKDVEGIRKSLGEVKGTGWGFDAGVEHIIRSGPTQIIVGLAALDITGTEFKVDGDNPNKLEVAKNRDQINLGLAFGQDFKVFHYNLSSDIRGLNEQMDFGKRVRLGAEFGIPGLSVMGGMNSGYYSYGATLDMVFMKVTAGFYDIELGSKYKQVKSKRALIYISLFDFSFDA